jgi:class 3 adenylate cyclase/predicted ATPase
MSFIRTVRQAREFLREEARISVSALKLEFDLDDARLEALIAELVDVQQVAAREGKVLTWIGSSVGERPALEPETSAAAEASAEPAEDSQRAEAERRHLTVMFCDLVDSTRLASGLDPEDWREVVRGCLGATTEIIELFDGHVAQYLGDGLLVYFGWPQAHEDDAERAVRTGLRIVDAVSEGNEALQSKHGIEFAMRVGIHTGPVVVGEMGGGASRETLAMGKTTNVAARIQGEAEPNTVVFSSATLRLVSGIFVTEDLGERPLKGAGNVSLHRALRATGMRSRLDVASATGLTPLVGRSQELGLLEDRFVQVGDGLGQAVLVSGEAGIGKSRLMLAFRERIAERAHSWLECRCSPYTQDSALFPVLDLQRQWLGLGADTPAEVKLQRLEGGLERAGFDLAQAMPLMASFHGLALPGHYAELVLSPEAQREKTLELLAEWVLRLGRLQPLVLLMEDLHWLDPSTQELLGQLLERIPRENVLLLATYRPDYEPPWGAKSHLTPMLLTRLTRAQLGDLIRKAARDRDVPAEWIDEIVRRSDGVPLFAEELTKTVLESHPEPPEEGEVPELHIPESLHDSLVARLDALGQVKELAQVGAVLGREFEYELLLAVSPMREPDLQRALAVAVREELFYQRGTPPGASYLFKHALLRDAAYDSLLRVSRQRHHQHVAETMVARLPELTLEQPELVAHHFSAAGDVERALPYFQRAGQQAADRSANAEAVRHFEKALALLNQLTDAADRERWELVLQVGLGAPSQLVYGYRTPETKRAYTRALELCREEVGDTPQLSQALWGLWSYYLVGSELDLATELGSQLLALAQRESDASLESLASLALGVPDFFRGRFEQALGHLDRASALYDFERDGRSAYLFGQDPGVMTLCFAAFNEWFLGRPERAVAVSDAALELALAVGHPYTGALASAYASMLRHMLRDREAALELAERTVAIATEQAFPLWRGFGVVLRARAFSELATTEGRAEEVQIGLADVAATGTVAGGPFFVNALAEVQEQAGQHDDALGVVAMASSLAETTGCRYWDADLCRHRGELMRAGGEVEEAERQFERALQVAREQDSRSLELRAGTALARLWQHQGKCTDARDLLRPIYDWFTEGFGTQDLKDAKALLDELAVGSRAGAVVREV